LIARQAERRFMRRLGGRAFKTAGIVQLNEAVSVRTHQVRPEIVWIEKGLLIQPQTLDRLKRDLPGTRIVAHQDDNPFGHRKSSGRFGSTSSNAYPTTISIG